MKVWPLIQQVCTLYCGAALLLFFTGKLLRLTWIPDSIKNLLSPNLARIFIAVGIAVIAWVTVVHVDPVSGTRELFSSLSTSTLHSDRPYTKADGFEWREKSPAQKMDAMVAYFDFFNFLWNDENLWYGADTTSPPPPGYTLLSPDEAKKFTSGPWGKYGATGLRDFHIGYFNSTLEGRTPSDFVEALDNFYIASDRRHICIFDAMRICGMQFRGFSREDVTRALTFLNAH